MRIVAVPMSMVVALTGLGVAVPILAVPSHAEAAACQGVVENGIATIYCTSTQPGQETCSFSWQVVLQSGGPATYQGTFTVVPGENHSAKFASPADNGGSGLHVTCA